MTPSTKSDVGGEERAITDRIARLRIWGTDDVFPLPEDPQRELVIGSDSQCSVRLSDRLISRRHAQLAYDGERWLLRDLASKNGIRVDGAKCDRSFLEAGSEIEIGRQRLIAESTRLIDLRAFLGRIMGWTTARLEDVDLGLRAVRMAATRRAPLMLCGDDDLVPVARDLHRHAFGDHRPFVMSDPRRQRSRASARSAANVESAATALQAALGGTLCVRRERLPRDFADVLHAFRDPAVHIVLMVCARRLDHAFLQCASISISPLAERASELARIIDEYGADARGRLGASEPFTVRDRDWIRRHSAGSLAEIAKGTLRLVAIRTSGNVTRAAELLEMSHVALTDWLRRRRGIPGGES